MKSKQINHGYLCHGYVFFRIPAKFIVKTFLNSILWQRYNFSPCAKHSFIVCQATGSASSLQHSSQVALPAHLSLPLTSGSSLLSTPSHQLPFICFYTSCCVYKIVFNLFSFYQCLTLFGL